MTRRQIQFAFAILLAFAAAAVCVRAVVDFRTDAAQSAMQSAQDAFQQGDFEAAIRHCDQAFPQHPNRVAVIRLAANAADRIGDKTLAVEWLDRFPADLKVGDIKIDLMKKSALLQDLGRLSEAEHTLATVIAAATADGADPWEAQTRLAKLLCGVGLRHQGAQLLRNPPNGKSRDLASLLILAKNGRRLFSKQTFERWYKLEPEDSLVLAGMLAVAWEVRDLADVEWLLEKSTQAGLLDNGIIQLHRQRSDFQSPADHLATSETTAGDPEMITAMGSDPDYLLFLAQVARRSGNNEEAITLLISAIAQDPWNTEANYSLAELLRLSQPAVSDQLLELVATLQTIDILAIDAAALLQTEDQNADDLLAYDNGTIRELCQQLVTIGRFDEAIEWADHAAAKWPHAVWDVELASEDVQHADEFTHPAEVLIDSNGNVRLPKMSAVQQPKPSSAASTDFQFEDVAFAVGLRFSYENGAAPNQQGLKMHQWTGGGVAVIDVDGDSWPDLYLTQGGSLAGNKNFSDQLFRNANGQRYDDVTLPSAVWETGFGQGVAAGDYNDDGFTDLYVGNVGVNRLLINQGDGTFVAEDIAQSKWTTSVAIADITGDGFADIYDVNYLRGDNVYTLTCDHEGQQRICGPDDFLAEADMLHVSDGRGGFVSQVVKQNAEDARGMGLVVGDLVGSHKNMVYVANDETANQLLQFDRTGQHASDGGFLAGVALNDRGQTQGSMGIACGDYDGNGLPDLFVTNYYSEANNMFRQIQPGVFTDEALSTRLSSPGFEMLGFGCQFVDANSDGFPELAVANGHLDDFTFQTKPFRMKPQLFANSGDGTFSESQTAGDYFLQKRLGRSMASLDWNKDGRQDLVVTHINDPVSLVENRGQQIHPVAAIKLIAVDSARDAIGANAQVAGRMTWRTAGDGYQCSNEDRLRLVCDDAANGFTRLSVQWPSADTEFKRVSVDSETAAIEGRATTYSLPR